MIPRESPQISSQKNGPPGYRREGDVAAADRDCNCLHGEPDPSDVSRCAADSATWGGIATRKVC